MGVNNDINRLFSMPDFDKIGQKGTYLSYDTSKGWSIMKLGKVGQFARTVFGMYQNTHLKTVYTQFNHEIKKIQLEVSDAQGVLDQLSDVKARPNGKIANIKLKYENQKLIGEKLFSLSKKLQRSWNRTYPNKPGQFCNHHLLMEGVNPKSLEVAKALRPDGEVEVTVTEGEGAQNTKPGILKKEPKADRPERNITFAQKARFQQFAPSETEEEEVYVGEVEIDTRAPVDTKVDASYVKPEIKTTKKEKPEVTFDTLPPSPSVDQIVKAIRNQLNTILSGSSKKHPNSFSKSFGKSQSISKTIDWIVGLLLDEIQKSEIIKVDDLLRALKTKMSDHNVTKEQMDLETFGLLVSGNDSLTIPQDLVQGKSYESNLETYKDSSWKNGENRNIELRHLSDLQLTNYRLVLSLMFKEKKLQEVMQKFLDERGIKI